jgi:hypothetical protein
VLRLSKNNSTVLFSNVLVFGYIPTIRTSPTRTFFLNMFATGDALSTSFALTLSASLAKSKLLQAFYAGILSSRRQQLAGIFMFYEPLLNDWNNVFSSSFGSPHHFHLTCVHFSKIREIYLFMLFLPSGLLYISIRNTLMKIIKIGVKTTRIINSHQGYMLFYPKQGCNLGPHLFSLQWVVIELCARRCHGQVTPASLVSANSFT